MANRIVTITGELGSGKSTVAKALTAQWGAFYHSAGSAQREIARRRGLTILELNQLEETDPTIDREVDSFFVSLRDKTGDVVVDSRLAWHFLPESFKVRLVVAPDVAALRINGDTGRVSEAAASSPEETYHLMLARRESEKKRFREFYGVDIENNDNFDLVVDTTAARPEAVIALVAGLAEDYFAGRPIHKIWTCQNGAWTFVP
ncbi:MAG: cytidylate kinase family protein [Rhodospirillales bacterium]|nr:cytidylate kinase family protein [Rhodospirillales bacterium]